jgi:carbamoyl-phosphate synthase large subunit
VLEGRPHIVDAIKNGEVQLVINTTHGAQAVADSFSIRRESLMHGLAYYTTVAGAKAVADSILSLQNQDIIVKPIQDYLN